MRLCDFVKSGDLGHARRQRSGIDTYLSSITEPSSLVSERPRRAAPSSDGAQWTKPPKQVYKITFVNFLCLLDSPSQERLVKSLSDDSSFDN